MKCLSKNAFTPIILIAITLLTGCGSNTFALKYGESNLNDNYNVEESITQSEVKLFASDLCTTNANETNTSNINASTVKAAGVFDVENKETIYSYNLNERINPASLTKIMTSLIVLENANLDDIVIVEDFKLDEGSRFYLQTGDKLTVRDLLYITLVQSANDGAIVLANYIAGSEDAFVEMMNQKAYSLGATNTNFANSHGLTNENHYTTAYDLYLIFNAAIKNDEFRKIINTKTYDVTYTKSNGEVVTKTVSTTNKYFTGEYKEPGAVTINGGKTGSTNAAGKCIILSFNGSNGKPYISIIMGANDEDILYNTMAVLINDTVK